MGLPRPPPRPITGPASSPPSPTAAPIPPPPSHSPGKGMGDNKYHNNNRGSSHRGSTNGRGNGDHNKREQNKISREGNNGAGNKKEKTHLPDHHLNVVTVRRVKLDGNNVGQIVRQQITRSCSKPVHPPEHSTPFMKQTSPWDVRV